MGSADLRLLTGSGVKGAPSGVTTYTNTDVCSTIRGTPLTLHKPLFLHLHKIGLKSRPGCEGATSNSRSSAPKHFVLTFKNHTRVSSQGNVAHGGNVADLQLSVKLVKSHTDPIFTTTYPQSASSQRPIPKAIEYYRSVSLRVNIEECFAIKEEDSCGLWSLDPLQANLEWRGTPWIKNKPPKALQIPRPRITCQSHTMMVNTAVMVALFLCTNQVCFTQWLQL